MKKEKSIKKVWVRIFFIIFIVFIFSWIFTFNIIKSTKPIYKENLEINLINSIKRQDKLLNNKNDLYQLKKDIIRYIRKKYSKVSLDITTKISNTIVDQSIYHNVSPELVLAIIEVESSFNSQAISKAGAIGLMQVMPEWIPKLGLKNKQELYEIYSNIHSGIRVLEIHIKENKGSIPKALYYYVGKDNTYSTKIFNTIKKFQKFRSSINKIQKEL